jgi:pilus assembly protein CpaE
MTHPTRSMLVISPDPSVSDSITHALSAMPGLRVDVETSTLTQMNGRATKAAGAYDIVLFQTQPDDAAENAAIESLAAVKRPGALLLALTDSDIALSQARALNRLGVDEVLPMSGFADEVGTHMSGMIAPRKQTGGTQTTGRIIAITEARGGAGATTLAVNLADQLACQKLRFRKEIRRRVALADLDLQFGTIGSALDLPEQDSLFRLASDATIPDAVFLAQVMQTSANGVSVLAAPTKFAPLDALRAEQVAAILENLRASHDYVIVELPRAVVGWVEAVMQRADCLMIVTDLSVPSIRHCRRLIEFFGTDNANLPIEIVVNRERRGPFASSVRRETEKALDRKLDHWLPDDPRAARKSIDRGAPLSTVAGGSALSKAIGRIAQSVTKSLPVAGQSLSK